MRLTVLCDNSTYIDRYYFGEPGFAAFLDCGERKILFDTGYSGVFMKNASLMGIDLGTVTDVVLSHGHDDHTGGLGAFLKAFEKPVRLIAHPDVFSERYNEGLMVGVPERSKEIPANVELHLTDKPFEIAGGVWFLGSVPRRYGFESSRFVGMRLTPDGLVPDSLPDDSSLAIKTPSGVFLLCGCAHAGVCNTLALAKEVTGEEKVNAVLGGMHLFNTDENFYAAEDELERLGAKKLYPCHCTSLAVKAAFVNRFDVTETATGLSLTL